MNPKLKILYDFLIKQDLVDPQKLSFEGFASDMRNPENRIALWHDLDNDDLLGIPQEKFMSDYFGEAEDEKKKPIRRLLDNLLQLLAQILRSLPRIRM